MKFFGKSDLVESFFLPKNTTIIGNILGEDSGRIEGIVKGDIKIKGKIIVAEKALVEGNLSASEAIIYGTVNGNVTAYKSFLISAHGVIHGDVTSNSIQVSSNAKITGKINKLSSPTNASQGNNGTIFKEDSRYKNKLNQDSQTENWW